MNNDGIFISFGKGRDVSMKDIAVGATNSSEFQKAGKTAGSVVRAAIMISSMVVCQDYHGWLNCYCF